jgi:nitric oxide reductase subunit B
VGLPAPPRRAAAPAAARRPAARFALTPSQRALGKYLFLVVALFVFQVMLGGFTAHYTVEGQSSTASTSRSGSRIRWCAPGTSRRAVLDRHRLPRRRPVPRAADQWRQGPEVPEARRGHVLFWALVVVVVGSFIGNYLAIAQIMPPEWNFWLGHQGYEYVDLGRLWQIGKFVGIAFWLVLMLRGIAPALLKPGGDKNLLALLTASVVAIGLFYGAGLFYGERTHLTVMEYWRWWVVHLWVEGFFEVFATTALAFIFATLGLVSRAWRRPPAWRRPRCSCWAAFPAPSTTCTSPAPRRR